MNGKKMVAWFSAFVLTSVVAGSAFGATEVRGLLTSDGVTGRGVTPHGWIDEKIYLGQLDVGWGAAGGTWWDPPGWYRIPQVTPPTSFPGGTYALFTLRFNGPTGFTYRTDVNLPDTPVIIDGVMLNTHAHYSVMYNAHYNEWAAEPWVWGTDFYQTFVATEPYVNRLATRLAGKSGDHYWMTLNFAIYEVNAGPPSSWTQISPTRSFWLPGTMDPIIHLLWVPYRSSEVGVTPGQTYAARFWRDPGSQSQSFAIVARPDNGDGYASGQLYSGDAPQPGWDAYAYISGGQLGTVINHAPVTDIQVGPMATWDTRFGQTFQATGTGVAAVEIIYATGDPAPPTLLIEFQVYDAVGGGPIGPPKTCYGHPGHYEGRAAAFWDIGDVPLVPGQMYYLEWTTPPSGCNTWYMNDTVPGEAYVGGVAQPANDLLMSIAEHVTPDPILGLSTSELNRTVEYEQSLSSDTFTVRNVGGETLNYTFTDDVGWLSVFPTSGTSTGEEDTITVNYDAASLPVDTHTATITVSAVGALNSPQTIAVTITVTPYPADLDFDGDVDQDDFGYFQVCYSGSGIAQTDPACVYARLDQDEDVDLDDWGIFQGCMSGPNVPADPDCAN